MSTLEYTIFEIRKGWRVSRTFAFAGAFAALVVNGVFLMVPESTVARVITSVMFVIWAVVFGTKARQRFFGIPLSVGASARADLELGLMLIVATHAGIQIAGGVMSAYYPALLILLAFLVVYTPQWVGFTLMAAAIGIETAQVAIGATGTRYADALLHAVFIAIFSLINLVFTRTEVARMRHRAIKRIEQARTQMVTDARTFRLTSAAGGSLDRMSREEEEERLSHCTVSELRRAMFHHLNLLKQTMDLHTCILFWKNPDARTMRILECISDSDSISMREYRCKEGIVGAILQSGSPMIQKELRPGHPSLVYYGEPEQVTDFLGIPVAEGRNQMGVLCADRLNGRCFTEEEKTVFLSCVESIVQQVSNERVFVQLQKAKSEQGRLLKASESLSKALSVNDVVNASLDAAAMVASFDLAAITLVRDKGRQRVMEARGIGGEKIVGLELSARTGLVGSVCKTGHFLPYRGKFDSATQVVYNKSSQSVFGGMRSLLVLPLISGEEVQGTLTVASEKDNVYTEEIRTTLQVMMNQLGTKVQNAQMVQKLEEMATTDGLTKLPNHRSFQEELTRQMAHSKRYGTETSVILCDVDKFKGVNDTYGHTVGDVVLQALGETLRRNVVRDTDMPARYGGEEFVIICGGTGTDGAVQLGERIRKDLESQVFNTEKGELRCTISMGVATYPMHAQEKTALVEKADQALYAAKEGGRNQLRIWNNRLQG